LFGELHEFHRSYSPNVFVRLSKKNIREYLLAALNKGEDNVVFVAEAHGAILGLVEVIIYIASESEPVSPRRYAVVDHLYVRAEYRRNGIGKRLIAHVHNWVTAHNVHNIRINVWSFNSASLSFYEHLGYHTVSYRL